MISIVIPVFNERESLLPLWSELKRTLEGAGEPFEVLFVDDGSQDGSGDLLEKLSREEKVVTVIRFRKNFGKSAALSAGFNGARGETLFTLDGDGQDDPREIPKLLQKLREGYDLVSGWKRRRQDPLSKTIPSQLFNRVTSWISGVPLHDFNCGFKCYRSEVVRELKLYGDLHRYIPVLAAWKGFRIAEVEVKHLPRQFGRSKYGIGRFSKGFFDLITIFFLTRYMRSPLYLFGSSGLGISALGFLICSYLSYLWFTGRGPIGTRPLLLLGVLLLVLGIQFISIGLLGELLVHKFHRKEDEYGVRSTTQDEALLKKNGEKAWKS